jgi:sugar phosphate isomerase/epimerase
MFRFSVYLGDQLDFQQQVEICRALGISTLEMDENFKGINITELNITDFYKELVRKHIYIPCINISKNSHPAGNDLMDMEHLKKVIKICGLLRIENLNIGDLRSFDMNLKARLNELLDFALIYNVKICVENIRNGFLNQPENLEAFFKEYGQGEVSMAFNPLEFVKIRQHPFFNVFYKGKVKKFISFLRINDGVYSDASLRLPGEGNAEIKELVSALTARNYKGFLSLAPYLKNTGDKQLLSDAKQPIPVMKQPTPDSKHMLEDCQCVLSALDRILLSI